MKYLVIGGGAIGSVVSAYMAKAGLDVTLLARGQHLETIQSQGYIRLNYSPDQTTLEIPIRAVSEEEYGDVPDVVIVAVKAYSFPNVFPLLDRVCNESTVVISLSNGLNIGEKITQGMKSEARTAEGQAYVACERNESGVCTHKEDFFEFAFGRRKGGEPIPELEAIAADLRLCGAKVRVEDDMLREGLRKLARTSVASGALLYWGTSVGDIMNNPTKLAFMISLCEELVGAAEASGSPFPPEFDAVEHMLGVGRAINPEYKTSLMYDYLAGKTTEADTMFFEPYEFGRRLGLEMASYGKVCDLFRNKNGS